MQHYLEGIRTEHNRACGMLVLSLVLLWSESFSFGTMQSRGKEAFLHAPRPPSRPAPSPSILGNPESSRSTSATVCFPSQSLATFSSQAATPPHPSILFPPCTLSLRPLGSLEVFSFPTTLLVRPKRGGRAVRRTGKESECPCSPGSLCRSWQWQARRRSACPWVQASSAQGVAVAALPLAHSKALFSLPTCLPREILLFRASSSSSMSLANIPGYCTHRHDTPQQDPGLCQLLLWPRTRSRTSSRLRTLQKQQAAPNEGL